MIANLNFKKMWAIPAVVCLSSMLPGADRGAIGDVVQSAQTAVNGSSVPSEWTLSSGDLVTTGAGGKALIRLAPSAELRLSENTSMTVERGSGHLVARMTSGMLGAETLGGNGDSLVVKTPLCTFESAAPGGSAYWVQISPDQTVVSANRGAVKIVEIASGEERIVPEGHHALISEAPAPDGQEPAGAPQATNEHKKYIVIIVILAGIAALGLGLGIWAVLNSGPASPSQP